MLKGNNKKTPTLPSTSDEMETLLPNPQSPQKIEIRDRSPQKSPVRLKAKDENSSKTAIILISIIILLYLFYGYLKISIFGSIIEELKTVSKSDSTLSTSILLFIQCIFSWFMLPGLTYVDFIMTALMDNYYRSLNIIFWGTYLAGIFSFFVVRYWMREHFLRKYGDMTMFKVFEKEAKERPMTVSLFVNFLWIPSCFKNILLPLTDMTFWEFAIPKFPPYLISALMIVNVASELDNLEEFIETGSIGKGKTVTEKFNFYLSCFLFFSTIIGISWAGWEIQRKCREWEEREMMLRREIEVESNDCV